MVRLPFSDFEGGSADNDAGGGVNTLMPRDSSDDTSPAASGSDADGGTALGDDGIVPAPLAGTEDDVGYTFGAGEFLTNRASQFSDNSTPAGSGSSTGSNPNPIAGVAALSSETFFESPGAGNGPGPASASVQAPAVSDGPNAAAGSSGDGQLTPGSTGQSGDSMPVPAFSEAPGGEALVSDINAGGASEPAGAAFPAGTLPLVGDLGVIYQAPTPLQSELRRLVRIVACLPAIGQSVRLRHQCQLRSERQQPADGLCRCHQLCRQLLREHLHRADHRQHRCRLRRDRRPAVAIRRARRERNLPWRLQLFEHRQRARWRRRICRGEPAV